MHNKNLSFQQENDILLNYILETSLIEKLRNIREEDKRKIDCCIELNITSVCNQKCDYCYLVKYGNELYPPEIRNQDRILNNIRIYLEYLIDSDINPLRIDLFSGEIWGMEFGNKVFDIILEYLDKGLKCNFIMIPSNMSFLTNDKTTEVVQKYIDIFRMKDVDLRFSASFDGKYIDCDTRSYKNESKNSLKNNDEFYERLFSFCKKNNFGFHPMVGAYKIEEWKKNYTWFHEMLKKYDLNYKNYIMFFEVRNDYWTQDKINTYLDFLNYAFDYEIKNYYNNDPKEFFYNHIVEKGEFNRNYDPKFILFDDRPLPACTIHKSLIVRMGDLAIGPCHRTHYDKFLYGRYIVENNKIVGLKANNVQLANRILLGSMNTHPKCSGCIIKNFCIKGCFGAQYETNGEILEPCKTVCNLFKQKMFFLIYKYEKLGLIRDIEENLKESYEEIIKIKNDGEYKQWQKEKILI